MAEKNTVNEELKALKADLKTMKAEKEAAEAEAEKAKAEAEAVKAELAEKEAAAKATAAISEGPKEYTVFLPKKKHEDSKFVGIDGKTYLVKRGVEVKVPEAVYNELRRSELAEQAAEDHAEALASKDSAELK